MSEGPPPPTVLPGEPHVDPDPLPPIPRGNATRIEAFLADSTGRGIAIALLAPIAGFGVAASCLVVPVVGQWLCIVFGGVPGLGQLAWIVPLDRWAARRGRSRLRKGLWIGASIVFLLNGSCWGAGLFLFSKTGGM